MQAEKQMTSMSKHSGWPIVGILPEFLTASPLDVLQDVVVNYGGLVELKIGPKTIYLVSDPGAFQRILRDNHKNYPKPDMLYGSLRKVLGNGLVSSEGEFWLRQRRMIQPYMHRKQLVGLTTTMTQSIGDVIENWQSYAAEGRTVDIGVQMSRITMNVITRAMFGQDISIESMDRVTRIVPGILDYVNTRGFLPFIPDWLPIPGDQKFAQNQAEFRAMVLKLINQRRGNSESSDLISMLLNTVDDETNEQMTDQQLLDEAITIFAAGYETTSNTLSWLWYILEQHPEITERIRQEIDEVLGQRIPTMEDVAALHYTKMVISECLRMFPAAPLLPRTTVDEDVLGNQAIPANAMVLMFYYGLHHNPAIWDNPELFRPERFLPEESAGRSQFSWVPFSAGPRKCLGDEFAMLEATLATVMILQRFNIRLSATDVRPRLGGTLRPSKPIIGTIVQR